MSVNLRLLAHFEAVYRLGSFSKAADELSLSHSAITKSVQTLETDWSTPLFNRTTRLVTPTQASRRLYPMAKDLLSFADAVKKETQQGSRELSIACGPAVLDSWIHPAIIRFRDQYPETKVNVESMRPSLAIQELLQRQIQLMLFDNATMSGLPHLKRLNIQPVIEDSYRVIYRSGHPIEESSHSFESLLQHDWAVAGYDPVYEANLPQHTRTLLAENRFPKYRLLSQAACIEMAALTDVLTLAPASITASRTQAQGLQSIPHPAGLNVSINAATLRESAEEPILAAFINALQIPTD